MKPFNFGHIRLIPLAVFLSTRHKVPICGSCEQSCHAVAEPSFVTETLRDIALLIQEKIGGGKVLSS